VNSWLGAPTWELIDDLPDNRLKVYKRAKMELLVRLKNTKKKAHRIGRDGSGKQIKAAAVCNLGLEGIVSKRLTSIYKSGRRKPGSRSKIRSRRLQRG
jgi:hypothetical protein